MRFPYVQERGRFLPVISLQLKGKGTRDWITFDAFVDSGASYSIFKAEIGDILGLEVEKSEKMFIICFDEKEKVVEFYRTREKSQGN